MEFSQIDDDHYLLSSYKLQNHVLQMFLNVKNALDIRNCSWDVPGTGKINIKQNALFLMYSQMLLN